MSDPVVNAKEYQSGSEGSDHPHDDEPERNFSSFCTCSCYYDLFKTRTTDTKQGKKTRVHLSNPPLSFSLSCACFCYVLRFATKKIHTTNKTTLEIDLQPINIPPSRVHSLHCPCFSGGSLPQLGVLKLNTLTIQNMIQKKLSKSVQTADTQR